MRVVSLIGLMLFLMFLSQGALFGVGLMLQENLPADNSVAGVLSASMYMMGLIGGVPCARVARIFPRQWIMIAGAFALVPILWGIFDPERMGMSIQLIAVTATLLAFAGAYVGSRTYIAHYIASFLTGYLILLLSAFFVVVAELAPHDMTGVIGGLMLAGLLGVAPFLACFYVAQWWPYPWPIWGTIFGAPLLLYVVTLIVMQVDDIRYSLPAAIGVTGVSMGMAFLGAYLGKRRLHSVSSHGT